VSKRHARLTYENGEYWIEDLGSENGTWMNDVKIGAKTHLKLESKIRMGWTIIELPKKSSTSEGDSFLGPTREAEAEVTIVRAIDETSPSLTLSGEVETDTTPMPLWQKLNFLNEFSQALGKTVTLDGLEEILMKRLQLAIRGAQRGALLLPDERGELNPRACLPKGDCSVSKTLVKRAFDEKEAFIWVAPTSAESGTGNDTSPGAFGNTGKSAIYVPLLAGGEVVGVMVLDNCYDRDAFSSIDLEMLKVITSQMANFIRERKLRQEEVRKEILRSDLLRQFSLKVTEKMLGKAKQLRRGGERVDPVTILVSDVRNFTALSAKMEPDDVVRMVNEMFDAFIPIIFEYDGVLDKYIGDSVLAVFGSPEHDLQQWEKAVLAALEMQRAIHILGEGRKIRRLPVFQVGIGVHSGEIIHGLIGSAKRTEFTVIGNTVNRASRYCDGAGPGEIFISKTVYEHIFRLVNVQPKTIKTKHPEVEPDLEGYVLTGLKMTRSR